MGKQAGKLHASNDAVSHTPQCFLSVVIFFPRCVFSRYQEHHDAVLDPRAVVGGMNRTRQQVYLIQSFPFFFFNFFIFLNS